MKITIKNIVGLIIIFVALFDTEISFSQKTPKRTELDTLTYKRVLLGTRIYKKGEWLSNYQVKQLYKDTWQPKIKYNWGIAMKPIGPVVVAGGVYLAYDALKGVPATTVVDGKNYDYTIRSLPKLLIGIGLVVGGGCVIESSNELVQHSVDIYNTFRKTKKTAWVDKVDVGLLPSTNVGLMIKFR